jgi:uncharacterized membrane protein YccC
VLAARRRRATQLLQARREVVALALELAEVRQARARARARMRVRALGCAQEGEALGKHRGQLALEARDLLLQRDARIALGVSPPVRRGDPLQ